MPLTQVDQGLLGQFAQYTGFKNRIINGAMVIDQRNAGASVSVTSASPSNTFSCDRFRLTNQTDGTFTAQQSTTTPAGFVNSLLITSTVADASLGATQYAQVEQRIEGNNVADLGWGTANAQAVTLSFWVRSSLTGTFCATLYNSSGSRCYVSTYTINAANTWEQKTITVAGDTGGTWQTGVSTGIDVIFCLAVGSTYQQAAGSWGTTSFAIGTSGQTNFMATTSNTFYITGVQLEKGSTATSFDYRPYGTELALCQRYYYRLTAEAAGARFGNGLNSNTTSGNIITPFVVTMRTRPTALEQSGTAADYSVLTSGNTITTCSAVPTFAQSSSGMGEISFTVASGLTAGQACIGRFSSTTAYLGWSAEL